ncbi:MAG: tyrosine-protein phosphatase [Oscillospiraceae bacterium]|nr:tyrosine-protein phosphatase [Oscillospiraceae bacterium]
MGSLLLSTRNTRALPTGTLRYIRSDVPENLTAAEIQWLLDNQITTVVDLRSEEERSQRPSCLAAQSGFRYVPLPVAGGGSTPKSLEQLYTVYRQMLDETMVQIVDTIMNAVSNTLYFCTAGKDRTGVVSAIILKRLGFGDEAVIEDYMMSKDNLMDMLTAYAGAHPEVDLDVIIPHRKNMERFLQYLRGES